MFRTQNAKACKHLWKCAVEHHTFFRLKSSQAAAKKKQNFVRMGSRFRYSGKTQFQATMQSVLKSKEDHLSEDKPRFERKPSQRFTSRKKSSGNINKTDSERQEAKAKKLAALAAASGSTSLSSTTATSLAVTTSPAAAATAGSSSGRVGVSGSRELLHHPPHASSSSSSSSATRSGGVAAPTPAVTSVPPPPERKLIMITFG